MYCGGNPAPAPWDAARTAALLDSVMKPLAWWFTGSSEWSALYPQIPPNPGYKVIMWFVPWWGEAYTTYWCTFLERKDIGQLTPLGEWWSKFDFR